MMNIGRLDRRITIQRVTRAADSYGELIETWADLATVWASKQDIRGSEFLAAKQTVASIDAKFKIRYLSGLKPTDRIYYDDKYYDIAGIIELGRKDALEIMASARAE